jgi:hypothetical protein
MEIFIVRYVVGVKRCFYQALGREVVDEVLHLVDVNIACWRDAEWMNAAEFKLEAIGDTGNTWLLAHIA